MKNRINVKAYALGALMLLCAGEAPLITDGDITASLILGMIGIAIFFFPNDIM